MTTKKIIFILTLTSLTTVVSAQRQRYDIKTFKHEFVYYQYDNDSLEEANATKLKLIKAGRQMFIDFDCCFEDTVEVYLNDRFLKKEFFKTNRALSFATSITVEILKNKQPILKVVLPNKKVFCEIILDKRYKVLKVNRMEHWNKTWWITFMNHGTIYQ